ncbi:MAG: Lrp/AsnC family transcriptional regulator [Actinobacteria bacterium]|nr:Lrp/AsnC family transcriptional regulator [Actinomycetota bacterium]
MLELDEADERVLELLSEDPRMSFAEMARRLNVSAGMVRLRFQRLQKAGVVRIVAITNPLLTGGSLMVMIGAKVDMARVEQIAAEISEYDEVVYLAVLAGSFDLLLEARFRDHAHLLDFLSHRLGTIDGVRDSEVFTNLRIVKETYY